jgi:hypothetical protein
MALDIGSLADIRSPVGAFDLSTPHTGPGSLSRPGKISPRLYRSMRRNLSNYAISRADDQNMAFVGLSEGFRWPDGTIGRTFAIIITNADATTSNANSRIQSAYDINARHTPNGARHIASR